MLLVLVVVLLVQIVALLVLARLILVLVPARLVLVLVWLVLVLVRLVLVLVSGWVLRPVTLLVAALLLLVLVAKVTCLLVAALMLRDVALVLNRLRSRLLNWPGELWDFRFLDNFLLLHAFPAFRVEYGDCSFLFAHSGGHHALLVTRDVVGRPLAAAPGVETILKTSAAGKADVAGDTTCVTLALIDLVVTCPTAKDLLSVLISQMKQIIDHRVIRQKY